MFSAFRVSIIFIYYLFFVQSLFRIHFIFCFLFYFKCSKLYCFMPIFVHRLFASLIFVFRIDLIIVRCYRADSPSL